MKTQRPSREALIKYYRGQSLPHEERLVVFYLSMDIDHEYVESCLREAWNNLSDEPSDTLGRQLQDAAWQKFQLRKTGLEQYPARRNFKWYGYAASITLFLLATVAVFHFKTSQPEELASEHFTAAMGKRKEIRLKDSSTVVLFPGSSLDVPSDFNGLNRKVVLKGRAFFEVTHNINKPFLVTAGHLITEDLGTSFEVNASGGAANNSTITLRTGKVAISYSGKEIARLAPDQRITYNTKMNRFLIEKVDARQAMSWIDGELIYDLAPLASICHDMEKWYNVKINIKNPDLQNKKITASFKDLPVTGVLDLLSETVGLSYKIEGNQITIN